MFRRLSLSFIFLEVSNCCRELQFSAETAAGRGGLPVVASLGQADPRERWRCNLADVLKAPCKCQGDSFGVLVQGVLSASLAPESSKVHANARRAGLAHAALCPQLSPKQQAVNWAGVEEAVCVRAEPR